MTSYMKFGNDHWKSALGYVFMLDSGAVAWLSKKQSIVTLSTTEAKSVAATSCACQAIWLKKILEVLHFKQKEPTVIFYDSTSIIKFSKNYVLHDKNKYIDVKYHFLRDLQKDEKIDLFYCKSEN